MHGFRISRMSQAARSLTAISVYQCTDISGTQPLQASCSKRPKQFVCRKELKTFSTNQSDLGLSTPHSFPLDFASKSQIFCLRTLPLPNKSALPACHVPPRSGTRCASSRRLSSNGRSGQLSATSTTPVEATETWDGNAWARLAGRLRSDFGQRCTCASVAGHHG
jgi:hypothetical protein